MRLASFILLFSSVSAFSQTYTASTFAGSGLPENLPATSVSLGVEGIGGIAADVAGNVFLSLPTYPAVVRVDAVTGILTRVAGNGKYGFSGDNGPAIGAQLNEPGALAVDVAGNLYVYDSGNNRVRKVANGVITTVAGNGSSGSGGDGGPATSAQLQYVSGLAVDSAGYLYIGDVSGVRKVSNQVITSLPGTQGYFGGIDGAGNVYVLDDVKQLIVKVANGVSTTVAGNGTYGFSADGAPATSASLGGDPDDDGPFDFAVDSAGNVYIADSDHGLIREVSNGVIATVAGGGASPGSTSAAAIQLNPGLIAVNAQGNLYLTDYLGSGLSVLEIAHGTVATVAGNGEYSFSGDNGPAANAQFYQPSGVAVDSAGRLYVADTLNNRVRMIANGIITTVAGTAPLGFSGDNGPAVNASLRTPVAVAVNSAGDLFIADTNNYRIRKVSGGVITTVAGTAGYLPCSVAADSAGDVYLYDCSANRVFKVTNGTATSVAGNGTHGSTGDNGPAANAGLSYVGSMAVDASGNLYLADLGRIRKISNGVITTIAAGTGVTLDASGNLYIVDAYLGLIRKSINGAFAAFPASPFLAIPDPASAPAFSPVPYVAFGAFPYSTVAADSSGTIYEAYYSAGILSLKPGGSIAPPASVSLDFVNNAGSNLFAGLTAGEIVTLAGSGLGPAKLAQASPGADGFYPTQLAGTSVQIGGVAAPLLYASATEVAAVVPYEVNGASAQVTVTFQNQTSAAATVAAFASAPGLFTVDGSGTGQAAAVNQDGSLNSASHPAPAGSIISLYATGLGQSSPAGVDGKVATSAQAGLNLPVTGGVIFGNNQYEALQVQYAGAAPGEIAGALQVNVRIPADVPPGSAVFVFLSAGGQSSQPGVTIAVSAAGN